MSEADQCSDSLSPTLYDAIIIGAGPCGLAVAARMCEHTPSALFTDDEHQRYHWIRKHGKKMSIMKGKSGCVVLPRDSNSTNAIRPQKPCSSGEGPLYKTLVLDATADKWMANWNRLFRIFDITHLRSPMFFHVDPRDRDGLLSFTYEQGRKDELREINNCVGKETSKYRKKKQLERMAKQGNKGPQARLEIDERDRKDYFAPSASLFNSHCECIVDRYGLKEGLIKHESVQDIDFGLQPSISDTDEIFTLTTNKHTYHTRAVVVAVGGGNPPAIPCQQPSEHYPQGMRHSHQITEFPSANVAAKIAAGRQTNILIIGGGLTAAQLADLAVRKGVTKTWTIMRTGLKIKPFDIPLEWMGKFRNHEKASFWAADSDEERLQQIRDARNGGSITPFYEKILKAHVAAGRVALLTNTRLLAHEFNVAPRTSRVTTEPPAASPLPAMDYIYFATGVASDFATLPFLQTLLRKFPLHGHGGFPCLSEDLMWRGTVAGAASGLLPRDNRSKVDGTLAGKAAARNAAVAAAGPKRSDGEEDAAGADLDKRIPLFFTGKLASLRLGPAAPNLEGARVGAERVTWALQEILAERFNWKDGVTGSGSYIDRCDEARDKDSQNDEDEGCLYRYCAGIGSRYERLVLESGGEADA